MATIAPHAHKLTVQPNSYDPSSGGPTENSYAFCYPKGKGDNTNPSRNDRSIAWSSGKQYTGRVACVHHFFRINQGQTPGRLLNFHTDSLEGGWAPAGSAVSSIAFDWKNGSTFSDAPGVNGLVLVLEANSVNGQYHFQVLSDAEMVSRMGQWIHLYIEIGLQETSTGYVKVWVDGEATPRVDLTNVRTVWTNQTGVLLWAGIYNSAGISSTHEVDCILPQAGWDWPTCLADGISTSIVELTVDGSYSKSNPSTPTHTHTTFTAPDDSTWPIPAALGGSGGGGGGGGGTVPANFPTTALLDDFESAANPLSTAPWAVLDSLHSALEVTSGDAGSTTSGGTTPTYVGAGAAANGTADPITPAYPAGLAAGDILILVDQISSTSASKSAPAGWTTEFSGGTGEEDTRTYTFSKVATGSESGTLSTTSWTGGGASRRLARIYAFRGAGSIEGKAGLGWDNIDARYPALTTTGVNRLGVRIGVFDDAGATLTLSTWTQQATATATAAAQVLFTKSLPTATTEAQATVGQPASYDNAGFSFALVPSGSAPIKRSVHSSTIGPDLDITMLVTSKGSASGGIMALARLQGAPGDTWDGYAAGVEHTPSGTDVWKIYKVTDNVWTELATGSQEIAAGDKIGFRLKGTLLALYYLPTGDTVWQWVCEATDSTYTAAGKVGLEVQSAFVEDFYAGVNGSPNATPGSSPGTGFGIGAVSGSASGGMTANAKRGTKVTADASYTITAVKAHLVGGGATAGEAPVRAVIYNIDGSNNPTSIARQSSELVFTESSPDGWYTFPLTSSLSVTAGQSFLVALHNGGPESNDIVEVFFVGTGGVSKFKSDTYSDGPSDPFGTPDSSGTVRYELWLEGTLTSAKAKPSTDISAGGWSPSDGSSPLYTMLDEASADDGDYIISPLSPAVAAVSEVKLATIADPAKSTGHTIRYRIGKSAVGGDTLNVTVKLVQGTTVIATWTHNDIGSVITTYEQTLSGGEADSITDYSDLRLRFEVVKP